MYFRKDDYPCIFVAAEGRKAAPGSGLLGLAIYQSSRGATPFKRPGRVYLELLGGKPASLGEATGAAAG